MRQRVWILLAALLFLGGCETEKIVNEIGHVGPARRDPFLAAQRFFEKYEFSVSTANRFGWDVDQQSTIVTPAQSFNNFGMAEHAIRWVRRGGHLVVLLTDGEAFRNDWLPFSAKEMEKPDDEVQRLYDELGIAKVERKETTATGTIIERKVSFESPSHFTWAKGPRSDLTFLIGEPDKPVAASFRKGEGSVTIIASAKPFRNRYIGENDHAWTFWLLVSHVETTGICFLQGVRVSFFGMLWEHGWMAIIPLALLIALWLWKHLPRFGPILSRPDRTTRDFASHLGIIGGYLWQQKEIAALLTPMRETVLRAADRRGLRTSDEDFDARLAGMVALKPAEIHGALNGFPEEPQAVLTIVRNLQILLQALHA